MGLWSTKRRCTTRLLAFGAAVAFTVLGNPLVADTRIVVSPQGQPNAAGTEADPLASLDQALERAREVDAAADGRIRIWMRHGVYRLGETVVIDRSLDQGEDGELRIEAYPGEEPVLSGAWPLPGPWAPVPGKSGAWQSRVPEEWGAVRTVLEKGRLLPRARGPGFRLEDKPPPEVPYRVRRAIDRHYGYLPLEVWQSSGDLRGGELRVLPYYPWVMNLLPLDRVDPERRLFWSSVPATYDLRQPAFGWFPGGTAWLENLPVHLDEPGEWVFDEASRLLTVLSGAAPPDGIEVARLTELLRIEGEVEPWDYEDRPVRGVTLSGLTFSGARRYAWEPDKRGWGLQHDWEMYDRPTAMVRLRVAERCRVLDCRFLDSGAAGLRADLQARYHEIRRCEFSRLGGVGVLLGGYGMGWKDVSRDNVVADCRFTRIGQEWWHSPAIFVWQSGHNRIIHNEISHVPYCGIVVSGRTELHSNGEMESSRTARWDEVINHLDFHGRDWKGREGLMHGRLNEVAWNDVHHFMERLADGNAIYVSGTGRGNHVHHNFIHDADSPNMNPALRCDDDQEETLLEDNVIARVVGEGIVVKGPNTIRHNLVYDLRSATADGTPSQYQRGYLVLWASQVAGSVVERNVFYGLEADQAGLFGPPEAPPALAGSRADHNLWWNPANPDWVTHALSRQQEVGNDLNSLVADPRLVDPQNNDFRLAPDSPARALGITGWDVSRVGPRADSGADAPQPEPRR